MILPVTGFALLLGFWASLYLLDVFLKTHVHFSRYYISFLGKSGLSVSILQLRWYTTCFNRLFLRLGQWRPQFLRIWFTAGVVFGLFAMMLSVFLLSLMVYNTLSRQPVEQQVLTPVMPGVNLPMSQVTYYLVTLLVCGILHEVGHAIAAVREQVRVNGFGIFIMALYPGAFVDLYTEHLQVISPLRQLRIYCAGVWHNFVIVLVAIFVLYSEPVLLMPFYSTGKSVVLTYVLENSAVSGPRGLHVGDHVTSISGCRVTSSADWSQCIQASMKEPVPGFCMAVEQVRKEDTAIKSYITPGGYLECCNSTRSDTHLCFGYNTKANPNREYACLPARTTTDNKQCRLHSDCHSPSTEMTCVYPSLDNTTKLLRVEHYAGRRPPLLFLGYPPDLHYSVAVSNYVPASPIVPVHLPYVIETFSKYLISLSGALAILNVVPCYALDGQWILLAFIELTLRSTVTSQETRSLIYSILILFGSLLLGTNIFIAMFMLFVR
ncbi:unnamed protein product [Owenia fusiformis]|uniref:Membrane-bound transcription factor site-2 protease n=1 Tax=Owenia fusiformis TaxID=6347 RepID=A0A8J1XKE6_OWEFU|nr:unnamed protein product [Owenia fusiformis]